MPEAPDAGNRDPFARPRLRFLQALVRRHAGAEDGRHTGVIDIVRQLGREPLVRDDIFRETAVAAVAGVMLMLAEGLPSRLAIFAA
jgi:hypothetical protein